MSKRTVFDSGKGLTVMTVSDHVAPNGTRYQFLRPLGSVAKERQGPDLIFTDGRPDVLGISGVTDKALLAILIDRMQLRIDGSLVDGHVHSQKLMSEVLRLMQKVNQCF